MTQILLVLVLSLVSLLRGYPLIIPVSFHVCVCVCVCVSVEWFCVLRCNCIDLMLGRVLGGDREKESTKVGGRRNLLKR